MANNVNIFLNHVATGSKTLEKKFEFCENKVVKYYRYCTIFNSKSRASKASTLLRGFLEDVIKFTSVAVNCFSGRTDTDTDSNGSEDENDNNDSCIRLDNCNEADSMDRDRVKSENARSLADYSVADYADYSPTDYSSADNSLANSCPADSSKADTSPADCCTECWEGKQEFEM